MNISSFYLYILLVLLFIGVVYTTDQCNIESYTPNYIELTEIDISSFITSNSTQKYEIASLFDYGFKTYGAVRLINTNITSLFHNN